MIYEEKSWSEIVEKLISMILSKKDFDETLEYLLEEVIKFSGAKWGAITEEKEDKISIRSSAGMRLPEDKLKALVSLRENANLEIKENPGYNFRDYYIVSYSISSNGMRDFDWGIYFAFKFVRKELFDNTDKIKEIFIPVIEIVLKKESEWASHLSSRDRVANAIKRKTFEKLKTKFKGKSKISDEIIEFIYRISRFEEPVLLYGETGVGKSLVARLIHEESPRKNGPFIELNCANVKDEFFESELFGSEKGAFTGAHERKIGFLEEADGGTLFLDEIGEMSKNSQAKFLKAIEEKGNYKFFRLGGRKEIRVDVRIISATNKDIKNEVKEGKFRKDLYYRLSNFELFIPPLRLRKEDILLLIDEYLNRKKAMVKREVYLTKGAEKILLNYMFPGNIRELYNILDRAMFYSSSDCIDENIINRCLKDSIEREIIFKKRNLSDVIDLLKKCNGNKSKASKLLGISRQHLYRLLKNNNVKI
ncbi:MAG: sigma-54 dependent transcriptional regulator [Acidobacteriota bacterium]